jgi:hypothetical protein
MHAAVAGCEAAANTRVATAELPAGESAAAAKSTTTEVTAAATEVTAAAKAAAVTSTKTTAAKAAAVASTKTTAATVTSTKTTAATVTAAAAASAPTSSGEGVSLNRGHAHGDDRENDCCFAQHQILLLRMHLHPWIFSDTPRQPARPGRVTNECGDRDLACLRAIAVAVRVLLQ